MYGSEKVTLIKVKDLIGDKLIDYSQGEKLFSVVDDLLQKGFSIEIDMSDVFLSSSAFFNSSLGELVKKYDVEFLKSRIIFKNLSDRDKYLLSKTISYAKKLKNQAA